MPLGIVTSKPGLIDAAVAKKLGPLIQKSIAETLDCAEDGGHLTLNDVEVRFQEVGPFDVNSVPFSLEIFANDFPSRRVNLQKRTETIATLLRSSGILPKEVFKTYSFVWILLAPAGFQTI